MPYFHGTYRDRLALIRSHGLGGVDPGPNSEACERGVYLSTDPRLCIYMLLMHHLESRGQPDASPEDVMSNWVVLLVDDSRIDARRMSADPHVADGVGSYLYRGVVDVVGAIELSAQQIIRDSEAGLLPSGSDVAWGKFCCAQQPAPAPA